MFLVLTGKTASGKDTIMQALLKRYPRLRRVVTTTSREPRENEIDDKDYHFISERDFRQKIEDGDFLEYVEYGGNFYGTEKNELAGENDRLWRIDPSRAGNVRQLLKNQKILVIYLTVDDKVVLKRLSDRGLSKQEITKRMQEDQKFWQEFKDKYDFVVENAPGKLDETLKQICQIYENS